MLIDKQSVNFFKTFGFLRLKAVFSAQEIKVFKRIFDSIYEASFKRKMTTILVESILRKKTYMLPSFADGNTDLLDIFIKKKLFNIPQQILGSTCQYWGSDGSLFSYNSLWHRDTATLAGRCKMNIYLNSGGQTGGAFRIIPGSHLVGDAYSNYLGNACAWPNSPYLGGLNENGVLPATRSPSASYLTTRLTRSTLEDIPHVRIDFNIGDILLFDDRAIHCVYAPVIPRPRRLITLIFSEQLREDKSVISNTLDLRKTSINEETVQLKQLECNQYNVNAYPEGLVRYLQKKQLGDLTEVFCDIRPQENRAYAGEHIAQHSDLKSFLTKNYR